MTDETSPIMGGVHRDDNRFFVVEDGVVAELVYEVDGDRLTLVHVGVPDEQSGKGIASALVAAAIEWARIEGLTVVPRCPFARKWLREHADDTADVTIDWQSRPQARR
jgi:predicted GNAT family acetyltransferase